ncbi:AraC family transcriptional regulator [Marinobacterium aestuarii]|uniref:AraC family transcriptional regulator n=1 Tax=Marinobacterium aestuarii TaxID=1821621 RepID=A0A1A9F471_9GAMM|nr:GlxA family transcriptional regulator [Marinobacterium aestuarii]ANG64872.1 AraC family transcriptional regulator [Marinobacterium aestuarii]
MFGDRPRTYPQTISFLLIPGFSLFGLTAMLDPLRHANHSSNRELYRWQLISEKGGLVASSDNLEIMSDAGIRDTPAGDTLIICAGYDPQARITPALLGFIRQQASHGADIGCQDTAAYIAAAAGILDGYRATLHWENLQSTAEAFPRVAFVQELLVVDRARFSCPGALSGLDMMLYLIGTQHGNGLATTVADELIYTHKRAHSDPQRTSIQKRLDSRNPRLVEAVQLMEHNLEEPLRISEIAAQLQLSGRELERLFRHYLQQTPSAYYRNLRLDQARWMLQQTSQSVTDISVACGFVSLSHFTRSYQQRFAKSPSRER